MVVLTRGERTERVLVSGVDELFARRAEVR
jgi:hypothetical protein